MLHSLLVYISFISSFNTSRSSSYNSLLLACVGSTLYCFATRRTSVHLRPPPPGYWYTSFFFLAGPGHLHEVSISALFSRINPLGSCKYVFIYIPGLTSCQVCLYYCSKCFSDPTLFLSANLSLLSILSSTSALYLSNFSADITSSSRFPSISFHVFSYLLSHLIPARPFVTFSHTALSNKYGCQPLSWHAPYILLSILLSHVSICRG